jgi:aminopeptidase N
VAPFNTVEQEQLTLGLLELALRALPELKRSRRIFFVNNWLAAFLGGQRSPAALELVQVFLRDAELDPDLRRKVLEAVDGLERTVSIRGGGR